MKTTKLHKKFISKPKTNHWYVNTVLIELSVTIFYWLQYAASYNKKLFNLEP